MGSDFEPGKLHFASSLDFPSFLSVLSQIVDVKEDMRHRGLYNAADHAAHARQVLLLDPSSDLPAPRRLAPTPADQGPWIILSVPQDCLIWISFHGHAALYVLLQLSVEGLVTCLVIMCVVWIAPIYSAWVDAINLQTH